MTARSGPSPDAPAHGRPERLLLSDHDVAELGLGLRDLMPAEAEHPRRRREIVAAYDYRDEGGELLSQVCRALPKRFFRRRPDGKGDWIHNMHGTPEVLYRLPELVGADPQTPVFVCEGEKDVGRLAQLGLVATCNPGGAGKWRPDYSQYLAGRAVVIIPDADEPGRRHADQVAASLQGVAAAIARKVEVQVQPGWQEPVNLYVVVVLEPGNRKSQVFRDATAPLRDWERAEVERLAPQVRQYETESRAFEGRIKKLEERAAKADDPADRKQFVDDAVAIGNELAEMTPVHAPKLIVDDCTPERLATLLTEQGGRIATMSPEGGVFDLMAGACSRHGIPMFGVYLKGHSGDDVRVDRVSRASEYVSRPAITMALTVQRNVIQGLVDRPEFRGRGLLARILYSIPKTTLGTAEPTRRPYRRPA